MGVFQCIIVLFFLDGLKFLFDFFHIVESLGFWLNYTSDLWFDLKLLLKGCNGLNEMETKSLVQYLI